MPQEAITEFVKKADENLKEKTNGSPPQRDPNGPQVVFPSPALVMTREEEDRTINWIFDQYLILKSELGVDKCVIPEQVNRFEQPIADDWMPKRELYQMMYDGDVRWRRGAFGTDSIFHHTNINLPVIRKIVEQQIAKGEGFFFDTDPWFTARPLRETPQETADLHEFFLQYKADKSRLKDVLKAALKRTFINGESIVKGTFQRESKIYEDIAVIAVDPDHKNEPVLDNTGDYIFETDVWKAQINEEGQFIDDDGNVIENPDDAVFFLEKDPTVTVANPADNLVFSKEKIRIEKIIYQGADLDLVHYQDILIPLQAKSIEDAECMVHIYDDTASNIVIRYMDASRGTAISDPEFLDMVLEMSGNDTAAKSKDGHRPDDMQVLNRAEPVVQIGEFYIKLPRADGLVYDVMMVVDMKTRRPIHYDYVARICPDAKRPFRVIRINPVESRWYGNSQVGLFWGLQELMDLCINRINLSQSSAGRIDIVNKEAFEEFDNNPNLTLNNARTLTTKAGFQGRVEDALKSIYLNDVKHDTLMSILQSAQQFAISLAGTFSANDGGMADLDSTKLATGIKHMEMTGQEMFAPRIGELIPGFTEATDMFFSLTIANLEEDEDFMFFQNGEQQFGTMVKKDIQDMDYSIQIELTSYKGEQQLAQMTLAKGALLEYIAIPPEWQQQARPFFERIFKICQIPNASTILEPVAPSGIPAPRGRAVPEEVIKQALPREQASDLNLK